MRRVLILTDFTPDYMADQIAHGCAALGCEVVDYPPKPSLHGAGAGSFDCEYDLPPHTLTLAEIRTRLRRRQWDAVIVPSLRRGVREAVAAIGRDAISSCRDVLIAIDAEDVAAWRYPHYTAMLRCEPEAYFCREPCSHTGRAVHNIQFSYPSEKIVAVGNHRRGVWGRYTLWPERHTGLRYWLAALSGPSVDLHGPRLPFDDYHAALRTAAATFVVAGGGWQTNRLWESVAMGCFPIIEMPPRGGSPVRPLNTVAIYVSTVLQCRRAIEYVLTHPKEIRHRSDMAQAELRAWHTTEARASYVLSTVHRKGNEQWPATVL